MDLFPLGQRFEEFRLDLNRVFDLAFLGGPEAVIHAQRGKRQGKRDSIHRSNSHP